MAVKKVVRETTTIGDTMNLSRHLTQVRAAIKNLPTDEGAKMDTPNGTTLASGDADVTKPKKTPTKKKTVVKKKPSTVKKKPAAPAKPAKDQVILADLAKSLKIEPRAARRILRTAKIKNPGRWAWDKGSAGLAAATKALKTSQAD